jgi:glycosyltransferase involved in cell wall biosynthesis
MNLGAITGRTLFSGALDVSVIIPVKNEEASICELLDALLNQTTPPAEIIITDGGSTDNTLDLIRSFEDVGLPVRLICEEKALPGRGRNLGIRAASSDWIAFIDAGVLPHPDWLESLQSSVQNDTDIVYGSWEPKTEHLFDECAAIAYVQPPSMIDGKLMRHHFIASSLFKREILQEIGGFAEHLRSAEDILLMEAAEKGGYKIRYAPAAVVSWDLQPNLEGTFRRFRTYARHNIRAGLWNQWQAPIFRRYGLLALLALPTLFFGTAWLLVVGFFWLAFLLGRSVVSTWRNRFAFRAPAMRMVERILILMPILGCLDAATFIGSLDWLVIDKLKLASAAEDVDSAIPESVEGLSIGTAPIAIPNNRDLSKLG